MGNSPSIYGFQLLEGQVAFCKMIAYFRRDMASASPCGLPQDEMGAPSPAAQGLGHYAADKKNWTIGVRLIAGTRRRS
jgi:hypothetical protein